MFALNKNNQRLVKGIEYALIKTLNDGGIVALKKRIFFTSIEKCSVKAQLWGKSVLAFIQSQNYTKKTVH